MSKDILKIRILFKKYLKKYLEVIFFRNFLCGFLFFFEGDRIIKVNGESVIGKIYF